MDYRKHITIDCWCGAQRGGPHFRAHRTLRVFADAPFPFTHYADPMWDTRRMSNSAAHFVTAHFDARLKGNSSKLAYLQVEANRKDGVYAVDRDGTPLATHSYWKGFKRGTAAGLVLERERERAGEERGR